MVNKVVKKYGPVVQDFVQKHFACWAVCTLSCFQKIIDQLICCNPNFCGMTVWVQIVVTLMARCNQNESVALRLSGSTVFNSLWFLLWQGPRDWKLFHIEPIALWAVIIAFTLSISIWHCHESMNTASTNNWHCSKLFIECEEVVNWWAVLVANAAPSESGAGTNCSLTFALVPGCCNGTSVYSFISCVVWSFIQSLVGSQNWFATWFIHWFAYWFLKSNHMIHPNLISSNRAQASKCVCITCWEKDYQLHQELGKSHHFSSIFCFQLLFNNYFLMQSVFNLLV